MVKSDTSNFIDSEWTAGKEVWCNLKGQYTHMVADLSTATFEDATICALGI